MDQAYRRDRFSVITEIIRRWISQSSFRVILKTKKRANPCFPFLSLLGWGGFACHFRSGQLLPLLAGVNFVKLSFGSGRISAGFSIMLAIVILTIVIVAGALDLDVIQHNAQ